MMTEANFLELIQALRGLNETLERVAEKLGRVATASEKIADCVSPGIYGGKVEWDTTFRTSECGGPS